MRVTTSCSGYNDRCIGLVLGAVLLACAVPRARAGEVHDLEEAIPIELEDVFPTPQGEQQLQLSARYERTHEHKDQGDFIARLQYGFAKDWQAAIGVPARAGDTRGSGDVQLTVFRKLGDERGAWPAFAASAQVALPTGRDSHGLDTTLKLISTKSLGSGDDAPRVHANLVWTHNAAPLPDERRDAGKIIAGYSQPLGDKAVVLGDVVHEWTLDAGKSQNVAEVGYLREVAKDTTLGVAIGAGIGQESPHVRLTLALQHSF